jgi:hypothetical protein
MKYSKLIVILSFLFIILPILLFWRLNIDKFNDQILFWTLLLIPLVFSFIVSLFMYFKSKTWAMLFYLIVFVLFLIIIYFFKNFNGLF